MRFGVALVAICVLAHVGLASKCPHKRPPTDDVITPTLDTTTSPSNTVVGNDDDIPTDSETSDDTQTTGGDDTDGSGTPDGIKITLAQLDSGVPKGKGEGQCGVADAHGCVPNSKAVDQINKVIAKYKITRRSEAVAVIALMAFESYGWAYDINVSQHRPGQGTMAMMMYDSVYAYAKYLYPSKVNDEWATLTAKTDKDPDSDQMNKVRAMVLGEEDTFGGGFWYLTKKLGSAYHNNAQKLRDGNLEDFKAYCLEGVKSSWEDGRETIWKSVNAAIK
ncbi:hypothetical protein H4R24_004123 [Coemansia sp. RSA 988]|nr:hypothetical protein H4R24_004123 [Coemansia sp. RSA 988]